jgi:hypothetical protein
MRLTQNLMVKVAQASYSCLAPNNL